MAKTNKNSLSTQKSTQTSPPTTPPKLTPPPARRQPTLDARSHPERTRLYAEKQELEAKLQVYRENLPHLFGFPLYGWAKTFIDSTNRLMLLCAANQISKSSSQIRKVIKWATSPKLWPKLWPTTPRIFWYLYPSKEVATIEVETKWIPEFLPRGPMKDDQVFGWELEYEKGYVKALHFKSGVTVYFKSYSQGDDVLQSATVHYIACDEELPEHLYSELRARLRATRGHMSMVFTATLNQETWRRAIEGKGENELFPEALKLQVSMYDCQTYADGSPSPWTLERIKEEEATCESQTEIDRRIHGRFVTEIGRKVPSFDPTKHYLAPRPIPADWRIYPGMDNGSGEKNHPGSLAYIAVNPEGTLGWVVDGWRGDHERTTAGDIVDKHIEMVAQYKGRALPAAYDHHARDLATLAERAGVPLIKANKAQDYGYGLVNTLFKNNMLFLFDTPELRKLGSELVGLMKNTPKTRAKDDFVDAMRYGATTLVPWDWETLHKDAHQSEEKPREAKPTHEEELAQQIRERRGEFEVRESDDWSELDEECAEWNACYGQ